MSLGIPSSDTGDLSGAQPKDVGAKSATPSLPPVDPAGNPGVTGTLAPDTPASLTGAKSADPALAAVAVQNAAKDDASKAAAEAATAGLKDQVEEYELELGKDSPLTEGDLEEIASEAEALNLSKEQAQNLIKARESAYTKAQAEHAAKVEADRKEQAAKVVNDPEYGGTRWKESMGVMQKAAEKFGTPEFFALLKTDIGNNPELARFLYRVGKAMESDGFNGKGAPAGPVKQEKNTLESWYPNLFKEKA